MADEIETGSGSKQRVAYDLAKTIAHAEKLAGKGAAENPRSYWLTLYYESLRCVLGNKPT